MSHILPQPGFRIGHTTLEEARTGVTVIAFDDRTLTAVEARGAAPGTRELDAFAPGRLTPYADAIVLTGGSAFGLRSADGVMQALATRQRGFPTSAGPVPLVPAAVVFDLAHGEPVAPEASHGEAAFAAALPVEQVAQGRVGAGTGTRWNNLGMEDPVAGGFGIGQISLPEGRITAVAVVNALGTVLSAGTDHRQALLQHQAPAPAPGEQTTLVAIITDIPCDHAALVRCCVAGHDALARSIAPAHTMFDGDVVFASTTQRGEIGIDQLLRLHIGAELAVEAAIASAVQHSTNQSWPGQSPSTPARSLP